ncbi:MAG: 2-hydroxyglutaryl-CoA dehydratase [Candidatus Methanoperedenaceae archaeon]|nr:MAG: 2-hydroxyglutaryl-CoA dehydratase [Candidatus Methanoperedenaceae archaeon]
MGNIFIGIDLGSTTVKAVALNGNILASAIRPTGANPRKTGEAVIENVIEKSGGKVQKIVATGYGRVSFSADEVVSEITAHAKGSYSLFPNARTIIDIGGQDSKITRINGQGNVLDFAMNDKCAAGTGRFIENTAKTLEISLDDFSKKSLLSNSPAKINSMCTVFAESEVISLLALGTSLEDVSAGVFASVASRIRGMAERIGIEGEVIFTGGSAKSIAMKKALESSLGTRLTVPKEPQIVGALGAAIVAKIRSEENL